MKTNAAFALSLRSASARRALAERCPMGSYTAPSLVSLTKSALVSSMLELQSKYVYNPRALTSASHDLQDLAANSAPSQGLASQPSLDWPVPSAGWSFSLKRTFFNYRRAYRLALYSERLLKSPRYRALSQFFSRVCTKRGVAQTRPLTIAHALALVLPTLPEPLVCLLVSQGLALLNFQPARSASSRVSKGDLLSLVVSSRALLLYHSWLRVQQAQNFRATMLLSSGDTVAHSPRHARLLSKLRSLDNPQPSYIEADYTTLSFFFFGAPSADSRPLAYNPLLHRLMFFR